MNQVYWHVEKVAQYFVLIGPDNKVAEVIGTTEKDRQRGVALAIQRNKDAKSTKENQLQKTD